MELGTASATLSTVTTSTDLSDTWKPDPFEDLNLETILAQLSLTDSKASRADQAANRLDPEADLNTTPDATAASVEQQLSQEAKPLSQPLPPTAPKCGDASVGLVYDPILELHCAPADHFENPARTARLISHLNETGISERCWQLPSRQATDQELLRAHSREHLVRVRNSEDATPDDLKEAGDIYFNEHTEQAARLAAGCVMQAVEAVMEGRVQRAFAVVRPPGHHALCERAMGFCFFNSCAVAGLAALHAGARRMAILDWDVHHGNGIQDLLEADPRIMYISLHRGNGFYPGTGGASEVGAGIGEGYTVNIPWPKGGFNDADYLAAFELVVEPILGSYAPDIIIVAAGFDAVEGDPMGGMRLSPKGYGHLTQRMMRAAPGGKVVLALEGGYNLRLMAECAAECTKVLLGETPADLLSKRGGGRPSNPKLLEAALLATLQAQAPFWQVLRPLASEKAVAAACRAHWLAAEAQRKLQVGRRKSREAEEEDFMVYK